MQACLTVGLLLWAAIGSHGPAHAARLDAGRLASSTAALRQAASQAQSSGELSAGLRALRALLPHHVLLLDLHSLSAPALDLPAPGFSRFASPALVQRPLGALPRLWPLARAP